MKFFSLETKFGLQHLNIKYIKYIN